MPNQPFDLPGDVQVRGNLKCGSFTPPDACIGNDAFNVGDPLDAVKQEHQYLPLYAQNNTAVVAAERKVIYAAYFDGTVLEVAAGLTTANIGGATVTVNILKNNTTIFSGTFTITNSPAAYDTSLAALDAAEVAYDAGDVFEVVVTAAAGGGTIGKGLWVRLEVREGAGS